MRILALRGHNLASLTTFDVPLADGPLAGVGLFAITGDTGAGKSTILDAMCLALYGKYPRTSAGGGEKVFDVDGEELQATDPRHILRRGAASGFAEADFIGLDGQAYRARWGVKRAYGRALGRMQPAEHVLTLLGDGTALAAQSSATKVAIVERSGFTFEQFCRTVLLAQGEFDRFLLANPVERTELLEKITGTEIYTRISARIFEETASRKRALDDLELKCGFIAVLPDAARSELVADQKHQADTLQRLQTDCQRLDGMLKHAGDFAKARAALNQALANNASAEGAVGDALDDRRRLDLLGTIEPSRSKSEAVARSDHAVAGAQDKLNAADAAVQRAQARSEQALLALAVADQARTAAHDNLAIFEPAWARASELDAQVIPAHGEVANAQRAAADAAGVDTAAHTEAAAASSSAAALTVDRDHALVRYQDLAAHEPLAVNASHIARLCEERRALLSRTTTLTIQNQQLATQIDGLRLRLKASDVDWQQHREVRKTLLLRIAEKGKALTDVGLPDLDRRHEAIRLIVADCDRAIFARERLSDAATRGATASAEAHVAETDRTRAHERTIATEHARALHSHARQQLQPLSDLADATISANALALRSTLVDGDPCPVCGGADHPYAHGQDAASEMARGIRRQRDALDLQIATAFQMIHDGKSAFAQADFRHSEAVRTADAATSAARVGAVEADTVTVQIVEALRQLHLPIAWVNSAQSGALGDLKANLTAQVATLATQRAAGLLLQSERDAFQTQADASVTHAEAAKAAIDIDREHLAKADESHAVATNSLAEVCERLSANATELLPYLNLVAMTVGEFDATPAAVTERFSLLARTVTTAATQLAALNQAITTAVLASTTAADRARSAATHGANTRQALAEREAALHALVGARANLLGGEDTSVHRSRIMAEITSATKRRDDTREASTDAEKNLAGCLVAQHAAACALTDAQSACDLALAAWQAVVAQVGMSPEVALACLAVPPLERAALQSTLTALDQKRDDTRTTLKTRQDDLDGLRAIGPESDDRTVEVFQTEFARQTAALDLARTGLAQVQFKLDTDDDNRLQTESIGSEIALAKSDHAVWDAVDDAIGQRDGRKFSRFAQGITLGHLVELANIKLQALNPRYALAVSQSSDLSLEVMDRDMGDERRGPRSLSGGERFLVSLALALALSGLEGRHSFVDSLFIDEGFGGLDRDTLDMAIDALESLQSSGRKVGVITHVAALIERIPVQIRVEKRGGGRSVVQLCDHGRIFAPATLPLTAAAE